MQKQAPSIGRILVAVGFALSCFGLLLFLWVTFGGPVPLAPQSYRFTADFPQAITLEKQSDVRIGGVSVGKVVNISLPPQGNATRATIQIDPQYAPISTDARAILRQKTLLGETYIELTPGNKNKDQPGSVVNTTSPDQPTSQVGDVDSIEGPKVATPLPEGGHLADTQVQNEVQIDEIFNAFDQQTREAFQIWQQNLAQGSVGRGLDLSDAFGNIGPFAQDASQVLHTLNTQGQSLSTLVNATGKVFQSLTRRDDQLGELIHGNNQTFGALASRDKALAEVIKIFPTFNTQARLTLAKLASFSTNAQPVAKNLEPVARDLAPTFADLHAFAPHAKSLFNNLDQLTKVGVTGLPALQSTVQNLKPVFDSLDPFLANLNPILSYTDAYSGNVTDFIANPEAGIADTLVNTGPTPAPVHALRQIGYISPETLSIYPTRLSTNRGNGYVPPRGLGAPDAVANNELFASHDCNNTGATGGLGSGQVTANSTPAATAGLLPGTDMGSFPLSIFPNVIPGVQAIAPCTIVPGSPFGGGTVPYVPADK